VDGNTRDRDDLARGPSTHTYAIARRRDHLGCLRSRVRSQVDPLPAEARLRTLQSAGPRRDTPLGFAPRRAVAPPSSSDENIPWNGSALARERDDQGDLA